MRGLLSLDQELRAARRAKGQKNVPGAKGQSNLNETERPWQPDIERVNQTMREVLRAVAGLSGVDLPGLPSGLQDDDTPPPRLDIRNLKERFRNDLEGFSIKVTEELTKQAREQTRTALEAVQNEVGGMVDRVTAEFRENLELPAQIEKLLEPCVEDAESRLEKSISQKFEQLVAQHEQLVQEKLHGTISSVQAQMNALEQTVQQIRELKVAPVAQPASVPSTQAADVEHLLANHDQSVQGRLQEALSPVHAQMSALEQAVQEMRDLNVESISRPSAEQASAAEMAGRIDELAAEFREKLQDQTQIDKLMESRVGEAAARLEKSMSQRIEQMFAEQDHPGQENLPGAPTMGQGQASDFEEAEARLEKALSQKVEEVAARHEQLVQAKLEGTLSSVQAQISALEQMVQQILAARAVPLANPPAEQPLESPRKATKADETSLNMDINGFLDQAFSRIELSFRDLPEGLRPQTAPSALAGVEEQRNAIPFQDMDREARIQQALDYLGQLGTKDPYPAS